MKHCHKCNARLPDDAKFCPECGAETEKTTTNICQKCDTPNPAAAKFCKNCGAPLAKSAKRSSAAKPQPGMQRNVLLLAGVAVLALIVVGIYHYLGFVKTVEGKAQMSATANPHTQEEQSRPVEEEHNHPVPSEAEIQAVKNQLSNDPENVSLNVQMGNILFDAGKFEEAMPYYQKALKYEPNNPDVIVDLGVCYFNLEQYRKAQEQFNLALNIDPQHVNALYNVGVVAVQLGEVERLIEYWGRLRKVAPNSPQAQRAAQILEQIHQNAEQNMQQKKSG